MRVLSVADMPEVFVSDASITRAVSAAVARGALRRIGSRLYTRNLDDDPAVLTKKHWYSLVGAYFPDALITDRTAIENRPAADGAVFLISEKTRDVGLPGLILRPRKGPAPLPSDKPFVGGVRLASTARAWLENMRPSRAARGRTARTLSPAEREERLDTLLRQQGPDALNRLRDDAHARAPSLGLEKEAAALSDLIGTLLGTNEVRLRSKTGRARAAGQAFDPDRVTLLETLFAALRALVPAERPVPPRGAQAAANLSFFDAYFSNFIEGTEFAVNEAVDIVFHGVIPAERPADAHDILGTFRVVSDSAEMRRPCPDIESFIAQLKARHAIFMAERHDRGPGAFKTRANRAGGTDFVAPDLVQGTLARGFEFLGALDYPFCRAVFMMFLVSEAHPFADGNGRAARIMTNAQLAIGGQERIIIPTVYREDYLGALRAFSRNGNPNPLIRMLDYAQRYTAAIDWSELSSAEHTLRQSHAFEDAADARLVMPAS